MINIRKAKADDFEQYLKLRKEDILEYSKIIKEKISLVQDSQIKKEFEGMIKSKDHTILVAEKEGLLVGYLTGSIIKNIWQHSGYIDDVFVSDKFKGKRVGSHLIEAFIEFLRGKEIKKCKLGVNIKNKKTKESMEVWVIINPYPSRIEKS